MMRCLHLVFASLLLASAGSGQEPRRLSQDTLAWVDGQPILARELRARVELMPWPGPVRPSTIDSVKSQAVSAMVAERLLSSEADVRGLTMGRKYDLLRWGLASVLQRDALFQREVAGRRRPSRQESQEAYRRYRENRTAIAVVTSNAPDADSLVAFLRGGGRLEALLRDRRVLDHDTVEVSFGMTDTLLERMVYEIGSSGVSRPRRMSEDRWVLLWLLTRSPNPTAAKQGDEEQQRSAERILQSRLDGQTAERYYRSTLAGRRARSDSAAFFHLAQVVSEVWLDDSSRYRRPSGFELTSDMVDVLHARLGEDGERPLVVLVEEALSIGQVVEMFRYAPFISADAAGLRFLNRLNEQVQSVTAGEYLSRIAHARGLHSDPSVQADLRSWNQYWAAGEMVRAIRDTVRITREDLVDELIQRKESFRGRASVMTEEVWTTDRAEGARMATSVLEGTPIASLTAGRARRLARIGPDGRSGWYDPVDDPLVGFNAVLADSGSVVGPIAVGDGFLTFRVLGVRVQSADHRGSALAGSIEPMARSRRAHDRVNTFIAELAQRRQVRVEPEAVKRTRVTGVPMFTRRYLGFGGWMNGAPMLLPLWEWVRQLPASSNWPL